MSSHKTETVSAATPASNGSPMPADLADERLVADAAGIGGMARGGPGPAAPGELGSLPVVIGLVVIWVVFAILKPEFLSSANLVNLTLQCAAVGTISIGIVLVLLAGDRPVGRVRRRCVGGGAGGHLREQGLPAAGGAGLDGGRRDHRVLLRVRLHPVRGAQFRRHSGLLGFLGLQALGARQGRHHQHRLQLAAGAVRQRQVPAGLAVLRGVVVVAGLYPFSRIRRNAQRTAAGLSVTPMPMIGLVAAALLVLLVVIMLVLNQDRGMSYMVLTFLILVVLTDLLIRRTRWGRAVMAVGGNVEAARRSGINVRRVYLTVFLLCSLFAALGGIFLACRGASAGQSTGATDVNLNAIAAAVIGGTSQDFILASILPFT